MEFINDVANYFDQLQMYVKIYACAVACALIIITCICIEIAKKQAEIERKINLILQRQDPKKFEEVGDFKLNEQINRQYGKRT